MVAEIDVLAFPEGTGHREPIQLGNRDEVVLGRSNECDVSFADQGDVSRRHAILRRSADGAWKLVDNASTNGTYLNGARIGEPVRLSSGDTIRLGSDGPTLRFERRPDPQASFLVPPPVPQPQPQPASPAAPADKPQKSSPKRPGGAVVPAAGGTGAGNGLFGSVSLSEVLPFLSRDRSLITKSPFFWPGVVVVLVYITIAFVATVQAGNFNRALDTSLALGDRQSAIESSVQFSEYFNFVLGAFLCVSLYATIAAIVGRRKPLRLTAGAALFTGLLVMSPIFLIFEIVFVEVLHGLGGKGLETASFSPATFLGIFVGIGLKEELIKALPVFLALFIGLRLSPQGRARYGINDPIDGILVACASAVGFVMAETLFQYVDQDNYGPFWKAIEAAGTLTIGQLESAIILAPRIEVNAMQLLFQRIISELVGHLAYSGLFGYAIGLAVLHRKNAWRIVLAGWLSAAFLHTCWDAFSGLPFLTATTLDLITAMASLFALLAVIRRARRSAGLSVPLRAAAT